MHQLRPRLGPSQVSGHEPPGHKRRGPGASLPRVVLVPAEGMVVPELAHAPVVGGEDEQGVVPHPGGFQGGRDVGDGLVAQSYS